MLDYSVDQLPALLKPVAKDLETLHELPAPLQAGGFQCLYCKVFASALRGRTTVLLVDGADLVDPVSLSVIFALTHEDQNVMAWNDKPDNGNRKPKSSSKGPDCTEADTNSDQLPKSTETSVEELPTATPLQRRDSSGDTSKGGVNRHSEATHDNRATLTCRSVIVLSTTQPLPIDASSTPNSQSGICLIQLSALEESAAQDFAARLFNCEELSSELRETLSGEWSARPRWLCPQLGPAELHCHHVWTSFPCS